MTASTLTLGATAARPPSKERMEELKYPEWQEPLLDAIMLRRSFVEIEAVIHERLHSLSIMCRKKKSGKPWWTPSQ
jgi:hypothetical protein